MERIFIISDTHFGHKNIIDYCSRPFKNVEEMDNYMISEWNKVITKQDKIFHLGDFSFGYNKEGTRNILSQLRGRKHLIMGNHDRRRSKKWWLDAGFDDVSEYPIIVKDIYVLSHEPIRMSDDMPYINIHGHLHDNLQEGSQYFNACVEHWGYRPFRLSEVF